MSHHADFVVVGSGSAGGTVAGRLSEAGASVMVIEAGPDFPDEAVFPPAFYVGGATHGERGAGSGAPSPEHDWGYRSEPLPNGRRLPLLRGKLVGGSSMANGCIAVRAKPDDFDRWQALGAEGWTWERLRPLFETVERELSVKPYPRELWLPVQELFAEACQEIGFRWAQDLNAPDAWDGVVGPWPRNRRNEIRQGSINTYIRRARGRAGFSILADTLVDRVLLEGGRAVGVACVGSDGRRREVRGDHVVLAAGAYGSASILLRSGIGPAAELAATGIDPVVDLPVGRRLLDHPGVAFPVSVTPSVARMGWPTLSAASRGASYWGIPMTADGEAGLVAFAFFLGLTDDIDGSIRLSSADPTDPPVIDPGFWAVAERGGFDDAWRDFQALMGSPAFRRVHARDPQPDLALRDRLLGAMNSGAHPAGGCAIGSVLDTDLAVLGIDDLTVADASVFPAHVTNNPNLTVHVVGEVAAQILAGTPALASSGRQNDPTTEASGEWT